MIDKGGRPTKYNAEMIKRTHDFVDSKKEAGMPPFIEGLAYLLDVDCDTIGRWVHKHKRFSGAIKRLKEVQREMLQEHIMGNNAAGGIFLLKNNHGFKDRTEQEVTTKTLPAPILKVDPSVHRDDSNNQDKPTA
jgi:hypothetical protein